MLPSSATIFSIVDIVAHAHNSERHLAGDGGNRLTRQTDPDVTLLHAAADCTRLAILRELSHEGAVCACDFTACCTVAQPTVSHHLKILREAGWVQAEHHGTNITYSLRPAAVERFRELAGELVPGIGRPAGAMSLPVLRRIEPDGHRG